MKLNMNENWYFTEEYQDYNFEQLQTLQQVRIPHTVKQLDLNYINEKNYQMVCGYYHKLEYLKEWKNKHVFLCFEGCGHQAEVYVNHQFVGKNECGYVAFQFDIQSYLNEGNNLISIKLDTREQLNQPPFGNVIDYLTYGGIYRKVSLAIKEKQYIEDVIVKASASKDLELQIVGHELEDENLKIILNETCIYEGKFKEKITYHNDTIKLWNLEYPNLYHLVIQTNTDSYTCHIGFRDVSFQEDGFYLNGQKIKLRGLNRHQSYPIIGYSATDSLQVYDAKILKEKLGVNCVRCSHYPQSKAFIEACDQLGLLVFIEIPGWQYIGDESWQEIAVDNVKKMVMQYRNHPSIFIWGTRINESADLDSLYQKTNEVAKSLDNTRPTGGVRNFKKSHLYEDVYTYNDFYHNGTNDGCEAKKKVTSDLSKGYLITEYNGHMYPTKSFDDETHRLNHALRHAQVLEDVCAQEDIAGSIGWCMFDYNTHKEFGSGDRVCYHGVLDMYRNPKLAAYVYASQSEKEDILEISSSMDIGEYPSGYINRIYAFTNCDSVKLYKNNEFVKEFYPSQKYAHMKHPPIHIDDTIGCLLEKKEGYDSATSKDIKLILNAIAKCGQAALPFNILMKCTKLMAFKHFTYEKGVELYGKYIASWGNQTISWKFEGIKDGQVVKTVIKEPFETMKVKVNVSSEELVEKDTYEMAIVSVSLLDQNNQILPYINRVLNVTTSKEVEIIGNHSISFVGGYASFMIQSKLQGMAKVKLEVDGIASQVIEIQVKKEGVLDETTSN